MGCRVDKGETYEPSFGMSLISYLADNCLESTTFFPVNQNSIKSTESLFLSNKNVAIQVTKLELRA